MKRLWRKVKDFFLKATKSPEAPTVTAILVSSYYIGLGLSLALATKVLVVLLIFGVPAVIWLVVAFAHATTLGQSNAQLH